MSEIVLIFLALLLVAACGVFVAAEFSLLTVNRNTVERLASGGDKQAQGISRALKTLSTQLSGAQVGITITNLAIGFLAEPAIATLIKGPLDTLGLSDTTVSFIAIGIGIMIATAVTMVFGELVPKNLAIAKPLGTAKFVQGPQRVFSAVMKPFIFILNGSANILLRRIGIKPQEELASARSADELSVLVRRSAEKGTLSKEMALMLERTLVFDELTALDVMTPRIRIHAVRKTDPVEKILELARATGLSRFPVISNHMDNIVGVVHLKHVFAVPAHLRHSTHADQIMRKPILVPSSIPLDALLGVLRKGGMQVAIVIDEFGGTDGLVTIEDVLEELVDELRDEHDRPTKAIRYRKDGSWVLSGLLRPDEVAEELGIFLPDEEEYETLGGLVTERLERMPEAGDELLVNAVGRSGAIQVVKLTIQRIDHLRVDQIRMSIVDTGNEKMGQKR